MFQMHIVGYDRIVAFDVFSVKFEYTSWDMGLVIVIVKRTHMKFGHVNVFFLPVPLRPFDDRGRCNIDEPLTQAFLATTN